MHNPPNLADLQLFAAVVQAGSLARAAAALGLSPSAVSKRLSLLEASLGARSAAPRGLLRVSTSSGFGRNHVAAVLSDLAARHPALEIRLEMLDRPVDPVLEGIDVDIRVGGAPEPHLYARRLAANRRVLCASPAYLAAHGRPESLADLARHRCLVIRERDQPFGTWRLEGPEGLVVTRLHGSLSTNLGEVAHRWALDGHGIVLRSYWDVAENLAGGRLERVLGAYSQEADVWAVHPERLSRSPRLEAFIALLVAHLARLGEVSPLPAAAPAPPPPAAPRP